MWTPIHIIFGCDDARVTSPLQSSSPFPSFSRTRPSYYVSLIIYFTKLYHKLTNTEVIYNATSLSFGTCLLY
jgi:hypothetical protein